MKFLQRFRAGVRRPRARSRSFCGGFMQLEDRLVLSVMGMPVDLPSKVSLAVEVQPIAPTPASFPPADLAVESSSLVAEQPPHAGVGKNIHAPIKPYQASRAQQLPIVAGHRVGDVVQPFENVVPYAIPTAAAEHVVRPARDGKNALSGAGNLHDVSDALPRTDHGNGNARPLVAADVSLPPVAVRAVVHSTPAASHAPQPVNGARTIPAAVPAAVRRARPVDVEVHSLPVVSQPPEPADDGSAIPDVIPDVTRPPEPVEIEFQPLSRVSDPPGSDNGDLGDGEETTTFKVPDTGLPSPSAEIRVLLLPSEGQPRLPTGDEGGAEEGDSTTLPTSSDSQESVRNNPGESPEMDAPSPDHPPERSLKLVTTFGDSLSVPDTASADRSGSQPAGSPLLSSAAALDAAIALMFGSDDQGRALAGGSADLAGVLISDSVERRESVALEMKAFEESQSSAGQMDELPVEQMLADDLVAETQTLPAADAGFAASDAEADSLDMLSLLGELGPELPRTLSQLIAGIVAADVALAQQSLDGLLSTLDQLGEASDLLGQASFAACLLTTLAAVSTGCEITRRQIRRDRKATRDDGQEDAIPPDMLLMMASLS